MWDTKMDKTKKTIFWLVMYTLMLLAIFYFKMFFEIFGNIIKIITPLITLYFGYKAYKFFGATSLQAKSALLITTCMGFFLIGDLYWIFNDNAVISIADLFWFIGYAFFIAGITLGIKVVDSDFFKRGKNLIVAAILFAVSGLYLKFFPLSWNTQAGFLENIVTYGYILLDVFLLFLTLLVLYVVYLIRTGNSAKFWITIGIGNIFFLIADSIYALDYSNYAAGNISDVIWLWGYIAYAISFVLLVQGASSAIESATKSIGTRKISGRKSTKAKL